MEKQRRGAFTDEQWEDVSGAYGTKCENEFMIESVVEHGIREGDENLLRLEGIMAEHLCPEHVHHMEYALTQVR